jgi:hypothetical protein
MATLLRGPGTLPFTLAPAPARAHSVRGLPGAGVRVRRVSLEVCDRERIERMKKLRRLVGGLAASAASAVWAASAAEPVWNIRDMPLERVSVVAHRGAGFLAPENTMGALELSWSMGCIPELDVRTTKDGHVMMFHDKDFSRIMPNAPEAMKKQRLEDLTFEEAKQLDIGAFRGPQFAGQRIVSLAEICAALKQDSKRSVYLDVKDVDLAKMARETEGGHRRRGGPGALESRGAAQRRIPVGRHLGRHQRRQRGEAICQAPRVGLRQY